MPALAAITYAPIVTDLAAPARARLLPAELEQARQLVSARCSTAVCVAALSWLAALNRAGARGYRGVIAPLEEIASGIVRATGHRCGERTAGSVGRVLEAAGYIERGLSGRGHAEQARNGEWKRRQVSVWTLTPEALALWSRTPSRPVCDKNLPKENFAGRGLDEDSPSGRDRDARAVDVVIGSLGRGLQGEVVNSAAPEASSDIERGAVAPPITPEPGAQGVVKGRFAPRRIISGRPRASEPATRARGVRCLVYDLESELRRRARSEREIDDCVRRVLAEAAPTHRGPTAQPWDDWVWAWRDLPQPDRAAAITSAIWPSVRAALKHDQIRRLPSLPYSPARPWNQCPGPRDPDPPPPPPPPAPPPASVAEAVERVADRELAELLERLAMRTACPG